MGDIMTLGELKRKVDDAATSQNDPDTITVVVTLAEPHVGARAGVFVKCAMIGFDWEADQFRLSPSEPIVLAQNDRDTVRAPKEHGANGERGLFCENCGGEVSHTAIYCSRCGQRLKESRVW